MALQNHSHTRVSAIKTGTFDEVNEKYAPNSTRFKRLIKFAYTNFKKITRLKMDRILNLKSICKKRTLYLRDNHHSILT